MAKSKTILFGLSIQSIWVICQASTLRSLSLMGPATFWSQGCCWALWRILIPMDRPIRLPRVMMNCPFQVSAMMKMALTLALFSQACRLLSLSPCKATMQLPLSMVLSILMAMATLAMWERGNRSPRPALVAIS